MTTRGWPGRTPRCRCQPGVVQPPQGLGDGAAVADAGVEDEVPQRAGDGGVLLAQNPIKEGVGDGEEW